MNPRKLTDERLAAAKRELQQFLVSPDRTPGGIGRQSQAITDLEEIFREETRRARKARRGG